MEKASEEFRDPARAVESIMLMVMIIIMMIISYRR